MWYFSRWTHIMERTLLYIVILSCGLYSSFGQRKAKVFSLFNVVRFPNDPCSGTSDEYQGICLASSECTSKGGQSLGACASGFGTCCLITVSDCGSTVTENCTYIRNPGFPSTYDGSSACNYVIQQVSTDICFIRLDFDSFSTRQPQADVTDADGDCVDTFTVSGAVGASKNSDGVQVYPPILCGENSGQHMYLDAGRSTNNDITLMNVFNTGTAFGRKWNIKVSQIACDSLSAPESSDCLQYFTSMQDTVKSFNFDGGPPYNHINNAYYKVCIRQAEDRCSVFYYPTEDPSSFSLDATITSKAGSGNGECFTDYLIFHSGTSPGVSCDESGGTAVDSHDRFCGQFLSCNHGDTAHRGVMTSVAPFGFRVYFNNAGDDNSGDRGFALNYRQEIC